MITLYKPFPFPFCVAQCTLILAILHLVNQSIFRKNNDQKILFQGQANFILVIQKHPKMVTFKSQVYRIRCVYKTGVQNIDVGFNVSMLTTASTIANTGPPPTCSMRICNSNGHRER